MPAAYFSWAEYQFMNGVLPKIRNKDHGMAVAVISNCNAHNNRLEYLKELMDNGVSVDSYGSCMHNKEFPRGLGNNYLDEKTSLISTYKFTIAFENSNYKDYVTEKLFSCFVAGSVPSTFSYNLVIKPYSSHGHIKRARFWSFSTFCNFCS